MEVIAKFIQRYYFLDHPVQRKAVVKSDVTHSVVVENL